MQQRSHSILSFKVQSDMTVDFGTNLTSFTFITTFKELVFLDIRGESFSDTRGFKR